MQPELVLAVYCLLIVGASAIGGLVPLWWLTHTRLHIFLSFAAGVMFGAAMLHMLFEAVELTNARMAIELCVAGFIALFFVERFFAFHHHEHTQDAAGSGGHKHVRLSWPAVAIGLTIHTMTAGIAMASAVMAHPEPGEYVLGFGVFLAIVLHQPADSFTIVTMMLGGGSSRNKAHRINFLFAMSLPLGALLFFAARTMVEGVLEEQFSGVVLAISSGMFLCIALSDLLPELQFHEHDRLTLSASLLLGLGLMFGVSRLHTHEHNHAHVPHADHSNSHTGHDHDHR